MRIEDRLNKNFLWSAVWIVVSEREQATDC